MITKVDLYNAPYEIASADRFYKDIDTKLVKHYRGNVKDFSFTITSTTSLTLTVNDEGIGKASYARIESSIFDDNRASYWFLTAITEIESDEGTRYTATLDAIATFGEEVFQRLQGKKIKIDRLHEDRYNLTGGNFELNKQAHGLINTDFKVGDTKGVELVYDGANAENETLHILEAVNAYANGDQSSADSPIELKETIQYIIDNTITVGNKKYWLYALLQSKGDPEVFIDNEIRLNDNKDLFQFNDGSILINDAIRNTTLIPVNTTGKGVNTIKTISKLQEGKILNIIKLPFKLSNLGSSATQILFTDDGTRYLNAFYNTGTGQGQNRLVTTGFALPNEKNITILKDDLQVYYNKIYVNELIAFKVINSFEKADFDSFVIPTSKLIGDNIMDFIANTKTPAEMKRIVDAGETERLEIGLLNPDIMPIEMYFHDNKTILDFYNFSNKIDRFKIAGKYVFNEMGIEVTLKISENQFAGWSENTIMSFATDQGATYLARNKYSNDAQSKAADLQKEMQLNQNSIAKRQTFGGGAVGGILSALNPVNWSINNLQNKQDKVIGKIADNKKDQIQASINDASATAPSLHAGSTHNLINLNTEEFKHNFNWIMKKPNKFLRNKMVEFYDRHGYVIHDWIKFDSSMIENRSKFNYIEVDEFKDFIGVFSMFDINVLNLLDSELKKGLRLWHVDVIDYNEPNLEKVITENI